jgi:hypothetical protein
MRDLLGENSGGFRAAVHYTDFPVKPKSGRRGEAGRFSF